ncbi:unnamed protein product [Trichogramma brassicae]|uniref:Uncharacterized protein n=1 Tax=Trichogramma brassicae TaxID=86971 RepID=A0A6H5IT13_9HYME|nr:unnamed protein product [Trichogramma brassicae]
MAYICKLCIVRRHEPFFFLLLEAIIASEITQQFIVFFYFLQNSTGVHKGYARRPSVLQCSILNIVISVRVSYVPARRSKAMRVRYVRAACPRCICAAGDVYNRNRSRDYVTIVSGLCSCTTRAERTAKKGLEQRDPPALYTLGLDVKRKRIERRERERERRRRTREVHIRVSELRARTISWFMMHKHDVSASTRGSVRNVSASHYNNRKNNVQFTRCATDATIARIKLLSNKTPIQQSYRYTVYSTAKRCDKNRSHHLDEELKSSFESTEYMYIITQGLCVSQKNKAVFPFYSTSLSARKCYVRAAGLSAFLGDRARATRREIASRARCSYANVTGLPRCPFVRASRKNILIYLHIKITSVIACYFVTATAANQCFSLPNVLVALHQFDYQMQTLASTAAAAAARVRVQRAIIQAGASARVHTTEARRYIAKNMRALGCTFIHRPLEGVTNLALVEREMTIARQLKIAADVSASRSISVVCGRTYIGLHARNIQQHTCDICKLCKTFVSMCHVLNTSCGFRAADSDEPKRMMNDVTGRTRGPTTAAAKGESKRCAAHLEPSRGKLKVPWLAIERFVMVTISRVRLVSSL